MTQATTDLRWLLDDLVDRVPGLDRAIVLSADGLLLSRSGTLTEDDAVDIKALSGTSAGALNAVALASGWCRGGREGARATLDRLWRAGGREAARSPLSHGGAFALGLTTHLFSPYELNPLDINPLRELLNELVDFAALRERSPMVNTRVFACRAASATPAGVRWLPTSAPSERTTSDPAETPASPRARTASAPAS